MRLAQALGQHVQRTEGRAGILRAPDEPADRHQTADLQVGEGLHLADRVVDLGRRQARLARVVVDVDLDENGVSGARPGLGGDPVETGCQLEAVDGLDDREGLDRAAGLVRLQGPDEMPGRSGNLGRLRRPLLDPVLAEDRQAGRYRGSKPLRWNRLRYGDEGDLARVAPSPRARLRDQREDALARGAELNGVIRYLRRRKLGISRSSGS